MTDNKKAAPGWHLVTASVFSLKFNFNPLLNRLKITVFHLAPWWYLLGGGHG